MIAAIVDYKKGWFYRMRRMKRSIAFSLIGMLTALSVMTGGSHAEIDAKAKLSVKKMTLEVGQKKKIKVLKRKKGAKYFFRSKAPKKVKVTSRGIVTARKTGTVKIIVSEKSKKKMKKIAAVTVKVIKKKVVQTAVPTVTPEATKSPAETAKPVGTQSPSAVPTEMPIPTLKPMDRENFETPANYNQNVGEEYGKLISVKYYSTTVGKQRTANIILPANYTTEKEYPVLYLLHGIGGDQSEWNGANPRYVVGNLIAQDEAKEMIVVMPNVRAREDDSANPSDIYSTEHFKAFDNFINDLRDDLMPYMEENYSVATGRENTAIAGLSMGGRESLYIGTKLTNQFAYIGAFCPAVGVLKSEDYTTEEGLLSEEEFTLKAPYNSGNTLIMIVKGTIDGTVGEWPKRYSDTLIQNGIQHIYYEAEGGHDFTVWTNGLYNFAKRIF